MSKTESSSYSIRDVAYHRNEMANRSVETILETLHQKRSENLCEEAETDLETRQIKQNRYNQVNTSIVETHLEKLGSKIGTFTSSLQIFAAFAGGPQSPLGAFISGLATAGNAAKEYVSSNKQADIQKDTHVYQHLGGLISEKTQDIQDKKRKFDQAQQELTQMKNTAQRTAELMLGNS